MQQQQQQEGQVQEQPSPGRTVVTTIVTSSPMASSSSPLRRPHAADDTHCLVCYSDLAYVGIVPCGHNHVCDTCHLRLRHLHKDIKCPICKTSHDKIIIDEAKHKEFDEYPIWGNELGSDFLFRQDVGMFFPIQHYEKDVLPLFGHHCTLPTCSYDGSITTTATTTDEEENNKDDDINKQQQQQQRQKKKKTKSSIRALQDHLRVKHRLTLCQLCLDNKRDFVSKLPRFTPTQLKVHLAHGDGVGSGFAGHPLCEFCKPKRFYDLTQLHQHLAKDHYKCHVCDKQGYPNQYFRNYTSLEKHFDRQHFPCRDVQCLSARFVVFENEIDLRGHELSVHGATSTGSTKIQLEFRVRRRDHHEQEIEQDVPTNQDFSYGLDGQAFVPPALPTSSSQQQDTAEENDGEEHYSNVHPLHLARTAELRAQAAQIRQEQSQESHEQAFPTLAHSHSNNNIAGAGTEQQQQGGESLRMGWTSGDGVSAALRSKKANVGAVTAEAFPTLPTVAGAKKSAASSKLRAAAPTKKNPFAAMTAAANSTPSSSWSAASAAAATTAPSSVATTTTASAFPPSSSNNSFFVPSTTSSSTEKQRNRESDLTPDNFPSLGGSSTTAKQYQYPAAVALSKKKKQQQQQQQSKNVAASLSSLEQFPPPPTTSSFKKNSVKQKVLNPQAKKAPPSEAALANVLQFPTPSSSSHQQSDYSTLSSLEQGKATMEQMKASLGPSKYKRLKKYTKDFASNEIDPEAYVDHAASLFDGGFADPDFWSFVPNLLASCPNESSAQQAIQYMKQLNISDGQSGNKSNNKAASGSWTTAAAASAAVHSQVLSTATTTRSSNNMNYSSSRGWTASASATTAAVAAAQTTSLARPAVPGSSKSKKNAWGTSSGASAAAMKAKAPVLGSSLAAAAAAQQQTPQTGTATKYMAKEKKQQRQSQQQQQQESQSNKRKNKKKERDELRALAFGK